MYSSIGVEATSGNEIRVLCVWVLVLIKKGSNSSGMKCEVDTGNPVFVSNIENV